MCSYLQGEPLSNVLLKSMYLQQYWLVIKNNIYQGQQHLILITSSAIFATNYFKVSQFGFTKIKITQLQAYIRYWITW